MVSADPNLIEGFQCQHPEDLELAEGGGRWDHSPEDPEPLKVWREILFGPFKPVRIIMLFFYVLTVSTSFQLHCTCDYILCHNVLHLCLI